MTHFRIRLSAAGRALAGNGPLSIHGFSKSGYTFQGSSEVDVPAKEWLGNLEKHVDATGKPLLEIVTGEAFAEESDHISAEE